MTKVKNMTPKQRREALKTGQPVDRMPIMMFHPDYAAKLVGDSISSSNFDSQKLANREIAMYRTYGVDEIQIQYFRMPMKTGVMTGNLSMVKELDLSEFSPENDHRQKINIEAVKLIQEEIGDEITLTYGISGPLTLAGGLVSHEALLRGFRRDQETVHELLRFTTDFLKSLVDNLAQFDDLNFFIFDPVASGSLISPKQFREFAKPYLSEIIAYIHESYDEVGLHICGNTTPVLQDIVDTGADAFSLDQIVSITDAKEAVGDQILLMGNIDPSRYFLQGSPQEIEEKVYEAYRDGHDTEAGFIIRSGCGVPYHTPEENMEAFINASIRCSREFYNLED